MNCYVCGNMVEDGSAFCRKCGFPMIVPLGATEDVMNQIRQKAQEYRNTICRSVEVGFCAFSHRIVTDSSGNQSLQRERTENIPLGTCGDLPFGQIRWYPEMFVRPHAGMLECFYYIRRGTVSDGMRSLQIPLPDGKGDIQIGVMQIRTGVVCFCIGNGSMYTRSAEIDVLA